MYIIRALIFCLIVSGCTLQLHADQMGSDSIVAKQGKALFRSISNSNVLSGFSVFEQGLMCEDVSTQVVFNAFFPISGNLTFNNGTLSLQRDLALKSPLYWGTGTLMGNGYAVEWPRNVLQVDFPAPYTNQHVQLVNQQSSGGSSNGSVSWSYDGNYVAMSGNAGSDSVISLYTWNDGDLDFVVSVTLSGELTTEVSWSPNSYYFVSSGSQIHSWLFDAGAPSLAMIDTVSSPVNPLGVQWAPNGLSIAVVYASSVTTVVYPVTSGIFSAGISASLPVTGSITMASLSWHSDSNRYVIGLGGTVNKQIAVVGYGGIAPSVETTYAVGQSVFCIAWKPSSMVITVGLGSGVNCLRLYSYNSSTFVVSPLANKASNDEVGVITDLAYNNAGTILAVTKLSDPRTYSLSLFHYDDALNQLYLLGGDGFGVQSYQTLGWEPNGSYLAAINDAQNVHFYELIETIQVLNNVKLFFGSDIKLHGQILVFGDCAMSGSGYDLDLSDVTAIIIEANSSLLLDNVTVTGLDATKITASDATGSLQLRNVLWHQESDTVFAHGSLVIQDLVEFSGSSIFAYTSDQPITIQSRATLMMDPSITFSFDPVTADPTLLQFADDHSTLLLNGAAVRVGQGGLQLLHGKVVIASNTTMGSTVVDLGGGSFLDNGITFGDGISAHDSTLEIRDSVQLYLAEGSLHYKNGGIDTWSMIGDLSSIKLGSGTALNVYHSMVLQKGMVIFGNMSTFGIVDSMEFSASIQQLGTVLYTNLIG